MHAGRGLAVDRRVGPLGGRPSHPRYTGWETWTPRPGPPWRWKPCFGNASGRDRRRCEVGGLAVGRRAASGRTGAGGLFTPRCRAALPRRVRRVVCRSCLCVCRSPVVGTGGVVRTGGAAGEIGSRATSGRSGRGGSCRFASPRPLAASSDSSSSLFACQPRRPARPVDQRATWRTSQGKVRPGIAACVVSIRTAPGVDCCSNAPMPAADRTELGVCMASRAVGAVETVGEAAVVGRRSSGERSKGVGWGVCCRLPPCTPERPRMRTRPTGSPHLQRTGSEVA